MSFLDAITGVLFPPKAPAVVAQQAVPRFKEKRDEELRAAVRMPQHMRDGFLWTEKLILPRACRIQDLSITGARVENIGDPIKPSLLADGVLLYFSSEKHEILCRVAWSKGKSFGLRFVGKPRPPSRAYKGK